MTKQQREAANVLEATRVALGYALAFDLPNNIVAPLRAAETAVRKYNESLQQPNTQRYCQCDTTTNRYGPRHTVARHDYQIPVAN